MAGGKSQQVAAGVGVLMPSGRVVLGKVRTPGQLRRAKELLALARKEFGRLPKTDRTVVLAASLGEYANFTSATPKYTRHWELAVKSERRAARKTDKAIAEARERGEKVDLKKLRVSPRVARPVSNAVVDPAVVRWLLTNEAALKRVDAAGVWIIAARFSSLLDLQNAVVQRALECFRCVIPGLHLMRARTRLLSFSGSLVTSLVPGDSTSEAVLADGLVCAEDVLLKQSFRSEGEVRLLGADVKGELNCSGGSFVNPGGYALSCDGLMSAGMLFLRDAASFEGKVSLTRASVGYLSDHPGEQAGVLNWPRELLLTGFRYDGIYPGSPMTATARLRWLEHHDNATQHLLDGVPDPQPYRQLAEVMKKQGHEEDARKVLFRYARKAAWRRFRAKGFGREPHKRLWNGFWSLLYWLAVGFGYKRSFALIWLIVFLVLGWFVFDYQSGRRMQPAQPLVLANLESAGVGPSAALGDVVGFERARRYPKFRPLIYSADALIPLVSFHQEDYWTPRSDPGAKTIRTSVTSGRWWTKVYLVVHISAGWVLATLFVASFTRLMRVD